MVQSNEISQPGQARGDALNLMVSGLAVPPAKGLIWGMLCDVVDKTDSADWVVQHESVGRTELSHS